MNCYYHNTLSAFLNAPAAAICNQLTHEGGNEPTQVEAWDVEIQLLQRVLRPWGGESNAAVLFEYTIPRLAKRVDVILLLRGLIFCLEFKAGQVDYLQGDIEQVMDYALDLKNFHLESHHRTIVPILIATEAHRSSSVLQASVYDDHIYNPLCINATRLYQTLTDVLEREAPCHHAPIDIQRWCISRYEPTPTIIEAAAALYLNHSVADITKSEASGQSLQATTDYLLRVIDHSREAGRKSICFVTGVPGAGKTLVGLNVAIEQSKRETAAATDSLAVYLSGNGPLVKVLTEALARDKVEQSRRRGEEVVKLTDARREVHRFIQEIYTYREQMLNKVKTPIQGGRLEIDESLSLADEEAGHAEIEHIAIFDEAQRSWTHAKLADWLKRGGSYGNKRKVPDFPMSEAEFLIWSLNLRRDWAVIVCLVGGGQEIHTGEAGIREWIEACNRMFPDWDVYISSHLTDREYAEGEVSQLLAENHAVTYAPQLHLSVSMRSFRAEKLSLFVHHLLNLDATEARALYAEIADRYPIVLTRDLEEAKCWLRRQARGSERYGIIVSSKAERLRPLALDVKRECDVVHWFLDDREDLRSSLFLEDVATEFDVQGLELDWACLTWDGDLRHGPQGWEYYTFSSNRWRENLKDVNREYQLNAYRVLLTRARQGLVICIPQGNPEDVTRLPEFYDGTFQYLRGIGLRVLGEGKL